MAKLITVVKTALIILISFLLAFFAAATCADSYINQAEQYPEQAHSLTLHNIPEDRQRETLDVLLGYAYSNGSLVVRSDYALLPNGESNGIRMGVAGVADPDNADLRLSLMGQVIIDGASLTKLMSAESQSATLGLDISAADMLDELPSFVFGQKLVVMKLEALVEQSGTVNGIYRVTGLTDAQAAELAEMLSQASGTSAERMLAPLSGQLMQEPLLTLILQAVLVASVILLFALFIVSDFYDARSLGIHLMCGWTRTEFAFKTGINWVLAAFASLPLACAVGAYASSLGMRSWEYYRFMCASGLATVLCVLLVAAAAAAIVFRMRPVDAIRNRVPRGAYLGVLAVFYCASVAFAAVCGYALDGPMFEIQQNAAILRQWDEVSDLRILSDISVGDDASSITGQSKAIAESFYRWYDSIDDASGVYLVNSTYYTQEALDIMRESGYLPVVPSRPFRYYVASPSYLRSQGFELDGGLEARAHAGERIYLIPSTMDVQLADEMRAFLTGTDSLRPFGEGTIQTLFYQNGVISFAEYDPDTALFNWEVDTSREQSSADSVILVCTPENMTFVESESLWASGLSNSYVKLDQQAAEAYLSPSYLSSFNLADNEPTFYTVDVFVAGMQKQLWQTLQMFGIVALIMGALLLVLALGLMSAYQFSYQEAVGVKRLMGYSSLAMYRLPFAIVAVVCLAGTAVMLALRSNLGLIYIALLFIMQIAALLAYARSTSARQLNLMLKE